MNAKELVLGKINASLNTLGMYVYSVVMGIDAGKFTRFMTNPVIDKIIDLSNQSITDSSKINYNIDKAIKDVQNEYRNGTMYSGFLKDQYAESVLKSIIRVLKLEPGIIEVIKKESNGRINLSTFFNSETAKELMFKLRLLDQKFTIGPIFEKRSSSEDFDDDLAGELESEGTTGSSAIDPVSLFRWYDDSVRLKNEIDSIGFSKEEKNSIIELFQRIKNEAGALKTLGTMLGINQSLKRTDYEFYKYNNILTDYINSRLDKEGIVKNEKGTLYYFLNEDGILRFTNNEKEYKDKAHGFNFEGFLNDSLYRENVIKSYGEFTNYSELNILEYLAKSDHFMEMIQMSSNLKEDIYPKLMVKFRSLSKAINELTKDKVYDSYGVYDKGLTEDVFNGLSNYFGDKIINEFFDNFNIKIKPVYGDVYNTIDNDKFISKVSNNNKNFYLNTLAGRTEFTSWFENILISKIKNGKTMLSDGTEVDLPELLNNKFLIATEPDSKLDNITKEKYYFLKPRVEYSFNMSSADSELLNDIVEDFKKLKDLKYGDYKIHDLFFLYNLIVNRNKSLRSSFTYILSQGIEDNPSALHNQYNNFVTEMDKSPNYIIDFDINDIKSRAIVPKSKVLKEKGLYKTTMFINNEFKTVYFDGKDQFTIPSVNLNKNIVVNSNESGRDMTIVGDIKSLKDLYMLLNSNENKISIKC